MHAFRKTEYLTIFLLLLLAAIPTIAGGVRIFQLFVGVDVIDENRRFFEMPVPVIAHIVGATCFVLVGAFQFSANLRGRFPKWHRTAGRIAAAGGMVAALTGMWMTLTFDIGDHPLLYVTRLFIGLGMALSIGLGVQAILKRKIATHRRWMIRGYAIGMGAGTQVLTLGFGYLAFGAPDELMTAYLMGAGWLINLAFAEWIIRGRPGWPAPKTHMARG